MWNKSAKTSPRISRRTSWILPDFFFGIDEDNCRTLKKNLDRILPGVVKKIIFLGKRFNGQKTSLQLVVVEQKERRGLPVNRP
jgi:hypothetical protein